MCLSFITIPSVTTRSSLYDQYGFMSRCSWSLVSSQHKLYYFLTVVDVHPVALLVGTVKWTYTPGCQSCFVWHCPLCPSLVLVCLCFPCDYDGTASLQ